MDVLLPRTLDEALDQKAAYPQAVCLAGGTDVMVEINFGRARPEVIIDVSQLEELKGSQREKGHWFLGAGATYTQVIAQLAEVKPLVEASRSVGSPQIRNRGTVGGNLGTASPAGDALPVLAAFDTEVVVASRRGRRSIPWNEFLKGAEEDLDLKGRTDPGRALEARARTGIVLQGRDPQRDGDLAGGLLPGPRRGRASGAGRARVGGAHRGARAGRRGLHQRRDPGIRGVGGSIAIDSGDRLG